jgi:glycosyltransferase involved in cell wall biosynthesis
MDKKVSVIIAVYNGENYLEQAIESALQQDYPEKEVIIVNDGSTDQTAKILETFAPRVIAIDQENRGLGAAHNTGVHKATGQYLSFLDHDDYWEKSKLKEQMEAMISFGSLDPLIFGQVKQFACPSLSEEERGGIVVSEERLPGPVAGTMLISKERFLQVGDFVEEKMLGEFIEWYLRAQEKGVPLIMLDKIALHRRVHKSNMGRQKNAYSRTDYLKILKNSLNRRRALK